MKTKYFIFCPEVFVHSNGDICFDATLLPEEMLKHFVGWLTNIYGLEVEVFEQFKTEFAYSLLKLWFDSLRQ